MNERYQQVLEQLAAMSARLGAPERDLVMLGEGNTSAAVDEDVFVIKASGKSLVGATPDCFVGVRRSQVLKLLDQSSLTDDDIKAGLRAASLNPDGPPPSIEATFHALLLGVEGVRFVAHTHPSAVNALLCSARAEELCCGSLFPDQVVCCGPAPLYIGYNDPGVPLARAIGQGIRTYREEYGENPRVILLRSHGLIAIGRTPGEVESATGMFVKAMRILQGTLAFGGPTFFTREQVARIHTRPDEVIRRKHLAGG